jgi:hypothetical protein
LSARQHIGVKFGANLIFQILAKFGVNVDPFKPLQTVLHEVFIKMGRQPEVEQVSQKKKK